MTQSFLTVFRSFVKSALVLSLLASISAAGTVSLDTTFNTTGYRVQFVASDGVTGESVAVAPDGKIVIGGWTLSPAVYGAFAAMRLNPNGSLDTSFSGDGIVTSQVNSFDRGDTVIVQSDGKILLGGDAFSGISNDNFTILRYDLAGNLDNTFNGNGIASPPLNGFSDEHAYDMLLSGGKILMVGSTAPDDNLQTDIAIMRFNGNGSLDTTFNGTGILVVRFQNLNESANAVGVQSDGKIVIGGYLNNSIKDEFLLMRFEPNGALDTTFGTGGFTTTSVSGGNDRVRTMVIQSDNKILVGGSVFVARYTQNGSLDTSFGNNGSIIALNLANKLVGLPGDKFLVGGTFGSGVAVSRYNANGSPDTTFNGSGQATATIPGLSCGARSIAVQSDSKILVGGDCSQSGNSRFAVFRFVESVSIRNPYDFDGDGKSDISIFRPSNGQWWLNRSAAGTITHTFGNSADVLAPGDFTGDGKTDVAVFRPSSGEWFVLRSENFSFYSFPFGTNGDIPVPGDYDGDGKTDAAVFRPSDSTWYIQRSSGGTTIQSFGAAADFPVPADYDGDGMTDIAIFRPSNGQWWLNRSTAGLIVRTFGTSDDKNVQGDYTGDGKADVAIWRPSTGEWFILRSEDSSFYSFPFGANGDLPSPGDYDGDGKFDAAVFRPSSATWYIQRSTAGLLIQNFGAATDLPIPNVSVRQ